MQKLSDSRLIKLFALYVALIGFLGLYRTGSWVPVFISLGIALITLAFAAYYRTGTKAGKWSLVSWLIVCLAGFIGSAYNLFGSHAEPSLTSQLMFLSEAAFAAFVMWRVVFGAKRLS